MEYYSTLWGRAQRGCALWARRVLKFDRLFAGGFLGLTAPAGLRVVVSPLRAMSIYAAKGGNKMAPRGAHLASASDTI